VTGFLAALGLLGTSALAGCGTQECNSALYPRGLIVDVNSPAGLAEGSYEVLVEADDVEMALALEYSPPQWVCSSTEQGRPWCEVEVNAGRDRRLVASVEPGPNGLTVNVYYGDDDGLAAGPEVARIQVLHEGVTVVDETLEPTYAQDEPNGEDCGVRTSAPVDLAVSPGQSQPAPLPPGPPRWK
jgi:hypothetical protein